MTTAEFAALIEARKAFYEWMNTVRQGQNQDCKDTLARYDRDIMAEAANQPPAAQPPAAP